MNLTYTTIQSRLPDFIYQELQEFSENANAYHPQPHILIQHLAQTHHLKPDMFFLTAGIDEAIQLCARAFGEMTYIFTPTYIVYTDVEVFGGTLNKIPSLHNDSFAISPNTLPDASLIFLANPNNPVGITHKDTVLKLVKNNSHAIVVIDEAYAEFTNESVITQVPHFTNLVVLRSFSKAYALAGNRIGYVVAHPEVISKIAPLTQWSNVSYLSVGAAVSALQHEDYFLTMRQTIIQTRKQCITEFQNLGFQCIPSYINAIVLKFATTEAAQKVHAHLAQHDIQVNLGNGNSTVGLDSTCIRMAVGTKEQMQEVLKVFMQLKRA